MQSLWYCVGYYGNDEFYDSLTLFLWKPRKRSEEVGQKMNEKKEEN